MGIFKKIFSKKKKEDLVEEEFEEEPEEFPEVDGDLICSQCNMPIHSGQRIKTFAGKKMHMKPCWFKLRKTAKGFM